MGRKEDSEGLGGHYVRMLDGKQDAGAALQLIVLGSGGGPLESNTTAFLVRSLASGWGRGSLVAVDAGVHLSAITRILEQTQPAGLGERDDVPLPHILQVGPFAGLELPFASPVANGGHIIRTLVDTYLITHAHLDHISGFVINTAGLSNTRPKRLAGLPSTIKAFKTHIFNNVIWPNLSDENNGAGLVTYMRLVEGGSPALGDGDSKGFLEVSDGLAVKTFGVSHGHCVEKHSHRGSGSSSRFGSFDLGGMGPLSMGMGGMGMGMCSLASPRSMGHHLSIIQPTVYHPQQHLHPREGSAANGKGSGSGSGNGNASISPNLQQSSASARSGSVSGNAIPIPSNETHCVYDSSAYFIRDMATGREVLIFGDVEPDSISLSPRNIVIWQEAAPKIVAGKLAAIFIECSYDDAITEDRLFGHLAPRYLASELAVLGREVSAARWEMLAGASINIEVDGDSAATAGGDKKRKRGVDGDLARRKAVAKKTSKECKSNSAYAPAPAAADDGSVSPKTLRPTVPRHASEAMDGLLDSPQLVTPTAALSLSSAPGTPVSGIQKGEKPLEGLKVVIIHVKEMLKDGVSEGTNILEQLLEYEKEAQLGCEFVVARTGMELFL